MILGYFRQPHPPGCLPLRQRAAGAWLALLAFGTPATAVAQAVTDSQIVTAQAAILDTGQMVALDAMDFGRIAQPSVAGTLTMTAGATPSCFPSPGIVHLSGCQPAHFGIMGRKNWLVRIRNMSPASIPLDGPGPATMTITNLTIGVSSDMVVAPGGPSPPGTFGRWRITSDSGIAEFRIGGRLNIGALQAPGEYTGEIEIQVNFN
jgi:hypothetical protein